MKTYFYFAILLGLGLLTKAFYMDDFISGVMALIPFWFAYSIYQPKVDHNRCTEHFVGKITSIKWSTFRLNTEKTYNVTVVYGNVTKTFKQLPPEFSHQFSTGDSISIQANPNNLKESYLKY
ncbi:hypothetical protein [Reichenbachiella versicolor]|uniref:hypothetical protein n=1 Tax=Reichenbachiella versicolor TaxID=1821036 RepID=UPI000D6E7272|nr:hypothetical protein [Reichenbachiella versicolor]